MDEQELSQQELTEQELEEFNIEDIIREFSDASAEQQPETEEEVRQEAEVEEAAAETDEQPGAEAASAAVTGDTVRLGDTIRLSDTVRLDAIPVNQGPVRNAQIIDDEEETDEVLTIPVEEKTEPYSETWEPEYEQPIAEYIPPQPIAFRPRSRLHELKRQLVAGPEKQYYALVEQGLGKLHAALVLSVLLVLISAVATAMHAFGAVPENRMRLMVFGQFWVMLVSALLGSFQLISGAVDLFRKRFSANTLLLFTFLLCCLDGILCLGQLRVPCCAAFSLQVCMALWSTRHERVTQLGQLDTMRKAVRLNSVATQADYYEGLKGVVREEAQVEHFMNSYESRPKLEKAVSVYTLIALCLSVAVGVVGGVLHGVSTGIQVASVAALAAMPASLFITISRPMAVLEKKMHALGAVLCGWLGVEGLSGKAVFPLEHNDLFPVGSVQLNGVKFFGNHQPDTVIAYAAALMEAEGNSLAPMFTQLLDSRNGRYYSVENFQTYEGGVGGEVGGEPVLAGSPQFLKNMGVELPEGIRISQAVCLSVDGELCGLFALNYEKDRGAAAGIATLASRRRLKTVLTAGDFMLTPDFIRQIFGLSAKRIVYPEMQQRQQLRQISPDPENQALAMVTEEGLGPVAYAVSGARSVHNAAKAGVIVHIIGGSLGILMMLALTILGATHLLIPANLFLYELIWFIPGFLITEWPRSI